MVTFRGMFVGCSMFSPGGCRGLRVCRAIWKKCCPVFEILASHWPARGLGVVDEVI